MQSIRFIVPLAAMMLAIALLHSGCGKVGSTPSSGPLVTAEPLQTEVRDGSPWMAKTYRITPLAEYDIQAMVLAIEYYRYGREANLSPVDFALGWGPMSDPEVTKHFTLSQKDRWCSWRSKGSPISMDELLHHSANVHIIPPNNAIAAQFGEVAVGDIVRIRGKLVEAQGRDGWTWTSSLSRDDQGERSCEIIWVEQLEILPNPLP